MGRSVVLRRGNQKDKPLSSASAIQDAIFTDNPPSEYDDGRSPDGSPKKPKGKYEESTASRLMGQQASANKLGHLSTYYSEAVVCDRCYMVYRELDSVREKKARGRRDDCRLQKEADMLSKKGFSSMDEYSRAIEHRIFKQRKFVSRLAKMKQPKLKDEELKTSVGQGLAGDSFFDEMGAGLPTNSMSHISSIQAEGSFFPYQNSYFDSDGIVPPGGLKKKQQRSVSTNILPPLPWQLQNNPEQQAEYVNNRANKNHFVKNIGTRIDQEYAMADMIEANQLASHLRDDSNSNPKADVGWLKATGQAAWDKHHSRSAGSMRRQAEAEKKTKAMPKPKPKAQFDPDKLLHPWQRDIAKKRRQHQNNAQDIRQKAEVQVQEQEQERRSNYFYREDDDDESDSDDDYDQYGQPKLGSPGKSPMKSTTSKASADANSSFLPPIHPSKGTDAHGSSTKKSVTRQLAARVKADGGSSPNPKANASNALVAHISETLGDGSTDSRRAVPPPGVSTIATGSDDDDDDDDDDNDEGIGWSPFAVSLE